MEAVDAMAVVVFLSFLRVAEHRVSLVQQPGDLFGNVPAGFGVFVGMVLFHQCAICGPDDLGGGSRGNLQYVVINGSRLDVSPLERLRCKARGGGIQVPPLDSLHEGACAEKPRSSRGLKTRASSVSGKKGGSARGFFSIIMEAVISDDSQSQRSLARPEGSYRKPPGTPNPGG